MRCRSLAIRGLILAIAWPMGAHAGSPRTIAGDISAVSSPARRLVILRFDGLSPDAIERYVHQRDPQTGKYILPWIRRVFYQEGIVFRNFYTRGQSLSGPSWAMLATGHAPLLLSNVELDRASGRLEDYLNNVLIQYDLLRGRRLHARIVEVLDEMGVALFEDLYGPEQKRIGLELVRRGTSWTALARTLRARFPHHSAEEMVARLLDSPDSHEAFDAANEEHLLANLRDPRFLYLSAFYTLFDHYVHANNDEETIRRLLERVDRSVGRVYTAIREGPYAEQTVLVLISDHGITTRPDLYSQGFNLANYFARTSGGGHHVLTKRASLHDFQFRSVNFLARGFVNPSRESLYLKGQRQYPTLFIDYDGNERAMLHFRNSELNLLHIVLQEMRRDHPSDVIRALRDFFFEVRERNRPRWEREVAELREELWAVRRQLERWRAMREALPKEWEEERKALSIRIRNVTEYYEEYEAYLRMLSTLLSLDPERFDPRAVRIADLIRPRTFGPRNSVYHLQNYVVGLRDGRIHLRPDGRVDEEATFRRLNYLRLLKEHRVRNNVQPDVSPYPVDFIALRIPYEEIRPALHGTPLDTGQDVIWLYGGEERQALLVSRCAGGEDPCRLQLRYVPIARLTQSPDGRVTFERREFGPGFPLRLWEDEKVEIKGDRRAWFEDFHSEREWIEATHRAEYAVAVLGLYEVFGHQRVAALQRQAHEAASSEERLLGRFLARRRRNVEPDLLVQAQAYWNFNIRDFNPGGNHGGFRRSSTHATWMVWGGSQTPLRRGVVIVRPYESLSFVPTLVKLIGAPDAPANGNVAEDLERDGRSSGRVRVTGFRSLPGEIVWEVFDERVVAR